MDQSLFLFLICERFVDARNVDRCVLVSLCARNRDLDRAVSILTSQYTMNLLSLLQNYVLIPSFENVGEDRTLHWGSNTLMF